MLFRIQALALFAIWASVGRGADNPKPACSAKIAGQLWPEAANHDPALRKKLSRCGELELCTRGIWRYRWESLTVRIDQLRGGSQLPKPAGCEVLPEATSEENPAGSGLSSSPRR
jgi:hypothetical protein